jgi:hypothetical protein
MACENSSEDERKNSNRRIDNLESNNPWITYTIDAIDRQRKRVDVMSIGK